MPLPPDWLVEWTRWIGEVVTIVVAARVFWEGAKLLGRTSLRMEAGPRTP